MFHGGEVNGGEVHGGRRVGVRVCGGVVGLGLWLCKLP